MTRSLKDFSVLTFDCYGTLIDWETGIWDAFQPLIHASGADHAIRGAVLECYARNESRLQAEEPRTAYSALLASVHRSVAGEMGLPTTDELDTAFGNSVPHWPAFPDSADSLRELSRHYKLVILSNIHNEGFAASNRKLGVSFDAVYTAEMIGSYKPSDRNFEFMLRRLREDLNLEKENILHTAQSLHHDHVPARRHDLANAWIDRQNLANSDSWGATARVDKRPEYDFLFRSLEEMAAALRQETGSEG